MLLLLVLLLLFSKLLLLVVLQLLLLFLLFQLCFKDLVLLNYLCLSRNFLYLIVLFYLLDSYYLLYQIEYSSTTSLELYVKNSYIWIHSFKYDNWCAGYIDLFLQNEKNRFASVDIETARIDTITPQTLPHGCIGKNGTYLDLIHLWIGDCRFDECVTWHSLITKDGWNIKKQIN